MKYAKRLLFSTAVLFFTIIAPDAYAQNKESSKLPPPPPQFRMELVYIFEGESTEFIFVLGNAGFKSVDSLKKFIGDLPPGSSIEWAPGCSRFGGEPLLSSEQEMKDFKDFCARSGVKFVLVPSG